MVHEQLQILELHEHFPPFKQVLAHVVVEEDVDEYVVEVVVVIYYAKLFSVFISVVD